MNIVQMYEKVREIYAANEDNYYFIGLRFEDKVREIGEVCEYSRHNSDREDEREFPSFGSEDYEEMDELDGTSAWSAEPSYSIRSSYHPGMHSLRDIDLEKACHRHFYTDHCYVVAGNIDRTHSDADQGEIVIKDAVVIAQIF